ncbi:hypothetical protein LY13_004931 [Prauserella aidingensis]|nr:hypothetical protein [Prauserella aidingensis]
MVLLHGSQQAPELRCTSAPSGRKRPVTVPSTASWRTAVMRRLRDEGRDGETRAHGSSATLRSDVVTGLRR